MSDTMAPPESREEAQAMLAKLGLAIQKCRSTCMENFERMSDGELVNPEEFYGTLFPWLFGDRCVLKAVTMLSTSPVLTPMDLFNILSLANRPENYALLGVWYAIGNEPIFPEVGTWCYSMEWPS